MHTSKMLTSALALCLACALPSTSASASGSKGWEEQAWRAGFLASHARFLLVSDIEDEGGTKFRVIAMRGFTNTHVDGVFIAPVGADGQVAGERLSGYTQTAAGSQLITDNDIKEFPGASFSAEHWWMKPTPATSFAQWWAIALAVPQQPRHGGCRFSSHDKQADNGGVWLPSACTMADPVTSRQVKMKWSGWKPVPGDAANWQLWVPMVAEVVVESRRYTINLRDLQMRPAHGPDPHWPLSLVPQVFAPAAPAGAVIDEIPVPIDQLDYYKWKAD